MSMYHPYFRGRKCEMLTLRRLSDDIAASHSVLPIIELVNDNSTTMISLQSFVDSKMPFICIVNPKVGEFADQTRKLFNTFFGPGAVLAGFGLATPALLVGRETPMSTVHAFVGAFPTSWRGVLYLGEPRDAAVSEWCQTDDRIYYHIFRDGAVSKGFMDAFPPQRRIILRDHFHKLERNADYEGTELFTDLTTPAGNPSSVGWGDFSVQGDHFKEDSSGGPAHAVAVHHVHYGEDGMTLNISHFVSDRKETTADIPGKIIEAARHLVGELDHLAPNDTTACREFRNMVSSGDACGLEGLKRLSFMHHLELMLQRDE